MKKVLLASLLALAFNAHAVSPFTFVAPNTGMQIISTTKLTDVTNAFKTIGSKFNMTDPVATAALDNAQKDLTLSIQIQAVDTTTFNTPTYSNGVLTWTNNFSNASSSVWQHVEKPAYDQKALDYRDAGGTYAKTAIMTGSSGVNRLLSAIDGVTRQVNGSDYTPVTSYNTLVASANSATVIADKINTLASLELALTSIQSQGALIDAAGASTSNLVNNVLLPAAARNASSFADLNALLSYHDLVQPN